MRNHLFITRGFYASVTRVREETFKYLINFYLSENKLVKKMEKAYIKGDLRDAMRKMLNKPVKKKKPVRKRLSKRKTPKKSR